MKIVSCGMKLRISVGNSSDHEWGSSELYIKYKEKEETDERL